MSNSLWPHGPQHARLFCPLLSPGIYSDWYPLGQWCYQGISSSAISLSFCLWSFPTSGSFLMSQLFTSNGQIIRTLASATVLPMNIWGLYLGWTGLISLPSKGLSRVFSSTTIQKHQFFSAQHSLWSNSHNHTWLLTKNTSLTIQTCIISLMSLLFNTLSRFVIAFLSRSEHF